MAEIEIWCGRSANRVYIGQVVDVLPGDKIRLLSEQSDGSLHDVTVEIEPGTLAKNSRSWFALLHEPTQENH